MNFNRDDVRAGDEGGWAEGLVDEAIRLARGEGCVGDEASGQVVAPDFDAIKVDDCAIVAKQAGGEAFDERGVGDVEGATEISGGIFVVRVRTVTDGGGDAGSAVAERGKTAAPGAISEVIPAPSRAGVGAGFKITPESAGRRQCD